METFWSSPVKIQWLPDGGVSGVIADTVTAVGAGGMLGTESEFNAGIDVAMLGCWGRVVEDAKEVAVVFVDIVEETNA